MGFLEKELPVKMKRIRRSGFLRNLSSLTFKGFQR